MPVFTALAVVGAIAAVGGTIMSIKAQKKAAKASAQQQRLQRRRSARSNLRQAQILRSQSLAGAEGAGSIGSSGANGGVGSVNTRLGGALGFSSQNSQLSGVITAQNARASVWSGIAGIGSQVFSAVGGAGNFGSSGGDDLTANPSA